MEIWWHDECKNYIYGQVQPETCPYANIAECEDPEAGFEYLGGDPTSGNGVFWRCRSCGWIYRAVCRPNKCFNVPKPIVRRGEIITGKCKDKDGGRFFRV